MRWDIQLGVEFHAVNSSCVLTLLLTWQDRDHEASQTPRWRGVTVGAQDAPGLSHLAVHLHPAILAGCVCQQSLRIEPCLAGLA